MGFEESNITSLGEGGRSGEVREEEEGHEKPAAGADGLSFPAFLGPQCGPPLLVIEPFDSVNSFLDGLWAGHCRGHTLE
jgi:hypothetical protein